MLTIFHEGYSLCCTSLRVGTKDSLPGFRELTCETIGVLERRSGLFHSTSLSRKDLCFCFSLKIPFLVLAHVVVKEVKFPLIVLMLIKVVDVEGKIPESKNAGNIGGPRLGVCKQYR